MGTTTKMAIPYPEATGLVKDGWEDMKDIADQVDAKSGLILLNTTSFSAVSSQSINSVFSSNYDNYLIQIYISTITVSDQGLSLRLRSTVDETGSQYYHASSRQDPATYALSVFGSNPGTSFSIPDATNRAVMSIFVGNPNVADETQVRWEGDGSSYRNVRGAGYLNTTTQYTGFTFFPAANAVTGKVSTYGYNL